MNQRFVTADTHFGHGNILNYENRPFSSILDMDEGMIERWNSVVHTDGDKVFVLGDFSFHPKERTKNIMRRLNGRKTLIMGNHDRGRTVKWWRDVGFAEVYRYPIIYGNLIFSHEPMERVGKYLYLYGHVHGNPRYATFHKNSICVSTERWNYTPVELQSLLYNHGLARTFSTRGIANAI